MQRRAAGLLLVMLTLIGVLALNATAARSVAGSGAPLPAQAGPGAGSCLRTTRTAGWVPVPCTEPHTAEVVQSWPATAGRTLGRYDDCMTAGPAYLGDQRAVSDDDTGRSDWSVPAVASSTVLVSGPGPAVVKDWSWQACVVRPIVLGTAAGGYRGRLHDVPATGVLPAELRQCFVRPGPVLVVGVSCTERHTGEILAARMLRVFGSTTAVDAISTDPAVQAQCSSIAGATTAAPDPTYGGRLQVVVNLHATGMGFVTSGNVGGNAAQSYVLYQASCALQTSSGRELSASIVGLGARPLPLQ